MPDLERLTDKLREDMAAEVSHEQYMYEKGFTRGKTKARLEVLYIVLGVGLLLVLLVGACA